MRLLAVALCVSVLSAASARAADPVIANDSPSTLSALKGNLIYPLKRHGKYVCMRRVGGKVSRATRVPGRSCGGGDLGLDANGRVVYPFAVYRIKHGVRVSARWLLYDLKSDRARRVKGLPAGGCVVETLLIWRARTVYGASCASKKRSGLWVKEGKRIRRITTALDPLDLTLRGGTLVAITYTGPLDDSEGVVQLMVGGKPCVRKIETSVAEGDHTWSAGGVWIANGRIVWSMGVWAGPFLRDLALLASKLPAGCSAPGPAHRFDFAPETDTVKTLAVDGGEVFYAGDDGLRSHALPAQPSHDPPPNDNFENAQSVTVNGPTYPSGSTAWATTQPGEPLANAKQTVWYTFTAPSSGTLYASAYGRGGEFAVYKGTSLDTLTPVAGPSSMYYVYIKFDAVAGERYWIDVGTSDAEPDYAPFGVRVATTPPAG